MSVPITLNNVANLQSTTTAQNTINGNNTAISTAFGSAYNVAGDSLLGTLNANNQQIINLPAPATPNSPVRMIDSIQNASVTTALVSGNNVWSGTNSFSGGILSGGFTTVSAFGAVGDGTTDDTVAIQNALNSGNGRVLLDKHGSYRVTATLTIPTNCTFEGTGMYPVNPSTGSHITADATVSPVINMNGAGTCSLRYMTITRAGGIPAANLIGIEVQGSNVVLEDVMSINHGVGFYLNSVPPQGISCIMTRCYTGSISDAHIVNNTWPEHSMSQCRIGSLGSNDYNCNAYMRFQGGAPSSGGGGPNTVKVTNCQFNQGTNTALYFLQFQGLSGTIPTTNATEFTFNTVHVEDVSLGVIFSDNTWNIIERFIADDCVFNVSGPFFALNPATTVHSFHINNCMYFGSSFAIATANIDMNVTNTEISGAVTVASSTITGSSVVVFSGNRLNNGAVFSGPFSSLVLKGNFYYGGTLTTSSVTGKFDIADLQFPYSSNHS